MKHYLTILLFCFTLSYGQTNSKTVQQKVENNVKAKESNEENAEFHELKYENKILKERLEQASDTINNQNSMVSGFSVIYTIITIIIALLGISLPILTYFFGIRPSQKALSEFEKNIDQKMGEYLENSRNDQIEQAIENLSGSNQELIISSINFLSITNHQGFKESQVFKIFKVLRESNLDDAKKSVLANLLSSKKNIYATDFFKSALFVNGNVKGAAIKYFANIDLSENVNLFRQLLKDSADQNSEFYTIMTYCAITNRNAVIFLLSDKEFVDNINQNFEEIIKSNLKHSISSFAQSFSITENEMKETYLYSKFI